MKGKRGRGIMEKGKKTGNRENYTIIQIIQMEKAGEEDNRRELKRENAAEGGSRGRRVIG